MIDPEGMRAGVRLKVLGALAGVSGVALNGKSRNPETGLIAQWDVEIYQRTVYTRGPHLTVNQDRVSGSLALQGDRHGDRQGLVPFIAAHARSARGRAGAGRDHDDIAGYSAVLSASNCVGTGIVYGRIHVTVGARGCRVGRGADRPAEEGAREKYD
jgi:hypothetical protein